MILLPLPEALKMVQTEGNARPKQAVPLAPFDKFMRASAKVGGDRLAACLGVGGSERGGGRSVRGMSVRAFGAGGRCLQRRRRAKVETLRDRTLRCSCGYLGDDS